MARIIRPDLSLLNKYHISKHRYYELKHFCLQYYEWKLAYNDAIYERGKSVIALGKASGTPDPTGNLAAVMAKYSSYMAMIEETAKDADPEIGEYLFRAVTEELSFTYLKTSCYIPCERDMYYDRYRRFFWLLDKRR